MNPIIRASSAQCAFQLGLDPAGRPVRCHSKSTVSIDGTPLCDKHAETAMMVLCGRNVKIVRGQ